MTAYFREHTLEQLGRFHVVEPTIVVEIAFDVIHRSNRHDSGFALRFPRIFRLRPDKDVARDRHALERRGAVSSRSKADADSAFRRKAGAAPPA